MADTTNKLIPTGEIHLDTDNPRYYGLDFKSEEDLQAKIEKGSQTMELYESIKTSGVLDPIHVIESENGGYVVIEGNRRLTCLRMLLREERDPPGGVTFEEVQAIVYRKDADWGYFNTAHLISTLRYEHKMEIEEIAKALQLSVKEVNEHIKHVSEDDE